MVARCAVVALLALLGAGCCCGPPCCNYPCAYCPCGMPCCEPVYPTCCPSPCGQPMCSSCAQPSYGTGYAQQFYGSNFGQAVATQPSATVGESTAGSQIRLVSQPPLQPIPQQQPGASNQQQPREQSTTITQSENLRQQMLFMQYLRCNDQRTIQMLCRQNYALRHGNRFGFPFGL
jgi:hypothetical protein